MGGSTRKDLGSSQRAELLETLELETTVELLSEPETLLPHEVVRRRRLRDRRSQLVAEAARATGEEHRAVNARLNRTIGIRSVNDATDAQLERSIEVLERELGVVG